MYLYRKFGLNLSLSDWIVQCLTSPPTQYRLSEITLLFDLSLYLDRTLAQRKAKSKVKVAHCARSRLQLKDKSLWGNIQLISLSLLL